MTSEVDSKRKCFTLIWKLENASYCYLDENGCIESPAFTLDEMHGTKWKLELQFTASPLCQTDLGFFLQRQEMDMETEDDKTTEIDFEIALLSSDCKVLQSWEEKNSVIEKDGYSGTWNFAKCSEVFIEKRTEFLPHDTLTARCRIWKSVGEMSKDVQCLARTRIAVEKMSFLWSIADFSTLVKYKKQTYEIKSLSDGEPLMSCDFFLGSKIIGDEMIYLNVHPNFQKTKYCSLRLSILDGFQRKVRCFQDEFWHAICFDSTDFTLCYTKKELMDMKNIYLPNDKLSFCCECAFSCGIELEEIKMVNCDFIAGAKIRPYKNSAGTECELSAPLGNLINDFRSLFSDGILCDIKLKTSSQTFPAHKCILSARSPVFRAMFSNTMKETIKDCVEIEDLNDETVSRMLQYIYNADIGELEWSSASDLYEASDKYQILNLKDICSSYLKNNLCETNACEALILADLHQDEDLKVFVQDFILSHGHKVINSEQWKQLAETSLKLAYETILLQFAK